MILNEVLERLKKLDFNDAFYKRELDRIAEDLDSIEQPAEAIDAIFEFIENHSDEDLGLPGPLVRFVEKFIGKEYEEKLVASLRRRPNSYNIWMLNRLLNYLDTESRTFYVGLMEELSRSKDQEVASEARFFLESPSWV